MSWNPSLVFTSCIGSFFKGVLHIHLTMFFWAQPNNFVSPFLTYQVSLTWNITFFKWKLTAYIPCRLCPLIVRKRVNSLKFLYLCRLGYLTCLLWIPVVVGTVHCILSFIFGIFLYYQHPSLHFTVLSLLHSCSYSMIASPWSFIFNWSHCLTKIFFYNFL